MIWHHFPKDSYPVCREKGLNRASQYTLERRWSGSGSVAPWQTRFVTRLSDVWLLLWVLASVCDLCCVFDAVFFFFFGICLVFVSILCFKGFRFFCFFMCMYILFFGFCRNQVLMDVSMLKGKIYTRSLYNKCKIHEETNEKLKHNYC